MNKATLPRSAAVGWFRAFLVGLLALIVVQPTAHAVAVSNKIVYSPSLITLQGTLPFSQSYPLSITSPANYPAGTTTAITFQTPAVNAKPDGVDDATARSYLSFSANSLSFTGPGQTQTVTITLAVPADGVPGSYGFQLITQGWPSIAQNIGASINATTTEAQIPNPPVVEILAPGDGVVIPVAYENLPLLVPMSFTAKASLTDPVVTSVSATVNDTAINLGTPSGLNSRSASAGASLSISQAGLYVVVASGTNEGGTATDVSSFRVTVTAPKPTLTIASPVAPNNVFTYRAAGPAASVPFSFTATSLFGAINTLSARIDGQPVVFSPNGIGTLTATGSFNRTYTTAATHTLEVTAITDNFDTVTASTTFEVRVVAPTPTIDITSPVDGFVFEIPSGATTASVPFSFTTTSNNGFVVDSVSATLGSSSIPGVATSGLGTTSAVSTGTVANLAPGSYTLTAVGTSAGIQVTDSVSFTVKSAAVTPPTVVIDTPPAGSVYTRVSDGPALSIPLTFTGTSQTAGGVITQLSASLGSAPLAVTTANLNTRVATGAATISVSSPGTYTINVTALDAYGTANASRSFQVTVVEGKTVSGEVFFDADNDRTEDSDEFGLAGVTVRLLNAAGQTVGSAVTDNSGKYSFGNIASGGYKVVATAPTGLVATTAIEQSVTVGAENIAAPDIGFFLNFTALQGLNADGKSHGFWKNNIDKAIAGKTNGVQVSKNLIVTYTARIGDFALAPYDDISMKTASATLGSKSSAPKDLLSLQLIASEYNYQHGGYIGGNGTLTFLFLYWGEHVLANSNRYSASYVLWAKDWFDAYNNSYGGRVAGPSPR